MVPGVGASTWRRRLPRGAGPSANRLPLRPPARTQSVVLRLGEGDFLTVRVPSPEAAAQLVATVNGRAATRAALRHKGAAVAAAAGGSAAAEAGP